MAAVLAAPIHILYGNFHDAIRSELERVQNDARSLEGAPDLEIHSMLLGLRDRCRFLDQVHSYHSSVEDEVHAGDVAMHWEDVVFRVRLQHYSILPYA